MPLFERMTVVGVGLIGGSLAKAAKERGLVGEVLGFGRTTANLDVARARGLVDRVVTSDAEAADADLVVLATPVATCESIARRFRPHARPTTILTDVGSVKGGLVAALETAWGDAARVVGAHPIAGSEAAGAAAARPDLFEGRLCILTPTPRTDPVACERVRRLWTGIGARVETMAPKTHDRIVARISHLPHLVAYALVTAAVGRSEDGRAVLDYAGTGFLDTTRIGASPAEIWRDIALANRDAIAPALADFRSALAELERLMAAGDGQGLERALAAAAAARRALGGKG
jgi:prephenate dehydrogenase